MCCGHPDVAVEPPHQELADLARAPIRLGLVARANPAGHPSQLNPKIARDVYRPPQYRFPQLVYGLFFFCFAS
jgi:hypothetical protein